MPCTRSTFISRLVLLAIPYCFVCARGTSCTPRMDSLEGAGDGAVRSDDGQCGAELPVGYEGCGVSCATSSCDDDGDAGGFGGAQSSQVALADPARRGVKQGSIHVD